MKNVESTSPILSPEISEKGDNGTRGRSRRRTAKEIAQMFEQLKQRHLTRKKEWHAEREELVKQAALANESKRILVELKGILEDLKAQLRMEEEKRVEAEEGFVKGRNDWELEKTSLLKIIEKLESQRNSDISCDKRLLQELDSVKAQLLSREREMATIQKSNSNNQKNVQEVRRSFEEEKRKLIREHDGEKRNWDKTRDVMLERIEKLQQQVALTRANTFPLHGSHVSSPFVDTSHQVDERSSREEKIASASCQRDEIVSEEPTAYNQFQRTVDQALNQIEKITQDLSETSIKDQHLPETDFQISPASFPRNTPERIRSKSLGPTLTHTSRPANTSVGSGEKCAISPADDDKSDISKSSCANYSCVEQKEICERTLTEISPSSSHTKDMPKSPRSGASSLNQSQTAAGSPEMSSSAVSISPASCSLPGFTESSADSPCSRPVLSEQHPNPVGSSSGSAKDGSPFLRSEKRYSKAGGSDIAANKASVSPKKLPSLHQTLLFGTANKSNIKQSESLSNVAAAARFDSPSEKPSIKTTLEDPALKLHTPYFQADRGYKKSSGKLSSSPRMEHSHLSADPQLKTPHFTNKDKVSSTRLSSRTASVGQDFIKALKLDEPNSKDFVQKRERNTKPSNDDFIDDSHQKSDLVVAPPGGVPAPPTRPKPNITIEKDTEGNVLRIISDTKFQKQTSPQDLAKHETGLSMQRPSGVVRDLDRSMPLGKELVSSSGLAGKTKHFSMENKPSAAEEISDKMQSRESLGTRGKSWIKRRLPFLDAQQKGATGKPILKDGAKKYEKGKCKSRSSSLKRSEERKSLLDVSTSEESEGSKGRERFRKRRGRKEHNEKEVVAKGRAKRYTRSKTDNPLEMRNLLSKFRASQFNSKKPSIVKQFERRLLENEIKTLDDEKEKQMAPAKLKESMRMTDKVCGKNEHEDDGYSGEDELEYSQRTDNDNKSVALSSIALTPSPSIPSAESNTTSSSIYPPPRFHRSLMDLHLSEEVIDQVSPRSPKLFEDGKKVLSTNRSDVKRKSPQPNFQFVRTSFSSSPVKAEGMTPNSPSLKEFSSTIPEEFVRGRPGRQSLPITKRNGDRNGSSKRLSWATDLERVSPNKDCQGPSLKPQGAQKDFLESHEEVPSTCVSSMSMVVKTPGVKDLEANFLASIAQEKTPTKGDENIKSKAKGRMSVEMIKKAANLERVFKKGPSRLRRYRRSETQPIAMPTTTSESESESEPCGMIRSKSMSSEAFAKEFLDETLPDLTSRFKKPTLSNRRLPSRWDKKL